MTSERCHVVVIEWPPGADRQQRAEIIAAATGKMPTICLGLASKSLPCVLATAQRDEARAATQILRERGVLAVYPSTADIESVGNPFMCKRLAPALGAPEPMYLCDPQMTRLDPRPLKMSDVTLLIKGRIQRVDSKTDVSDNSSVSSYGYGGGVGPFGPFGGPLGPFYNDSLDTLSTGKVTTRNTSSYEVIDLYTATDPAVRIDARRFNYELLGKRSLTDSENMNRLAVLLAEQATSAFLDLDFNPASSFAHLSTRRTNVQTGTSVDDRGPAFDFYSRLQCIIDRALRKAGRR